MNYEPLTDKHNWESNSVTSIRHNHTTRNESILTEFAVEEGTKHKKNMGNKI